MDEKTVANEEGLWEDDEYESARLAWEDRPTNWEGVLRSDQSEFLSLKKEMHVLQDTIKEAKLGELLVQESWLGLYVPDGKLKEGEQPEVDYLKPLFAKAQEMPEWQMLRKSTSGDGEVSAYGAASFILEFGKNLPDELMREMEEAKKLAEAAEQAEKELQEMMAAQAMENERGQPGKAKNLQPQIDSAGERAAQARQNLNNQKQKLMQALKENEGQVEQAISKSSQTAQDKTSDLKDAVEMLKDFGTAPGKEQRKKIDELEKMAEYLQKNKNLKLLLDTLGKTRQLIQAEMRKSVYGKDTLVEIRGKELDLETLQTEELIGLMAEPGSVLWIDTMIRMMGDELLHRRYEGEERIGRGPLVVVHDKSGSMQGGPNAVACAIVLALILEMRKQGRRVISIPFSNTGQWTVFEAIPGKTTMDEIMKHVEFGWWGGTEPYQPLEKAIQIIEEDKSMKNGDVLIITDGAFGKAQEEFLEKLRKAREKPGLRMTAVVIHSDAGEAGFADKVIPVMDLVEERDKLNEAVAGVL